MLYFNDQSVTEFPRSNVFAFTREGKLVTPVRDILRGITRKQVLALAGEWIVEEQGSAAAGTGFSAGSICQRHYPEIIAGGFDRRKDDRRWATWSLTKNCFTNSWNWSEDGGPLSLVLFLRSDYPYAITQFKRGLLRIFG